MHIHVYFVVCKVKKICFGLSGLLKLISACFEFDLGYFLYFLFVFGFIDLLIVICGNFTLGA